MIYLVFCKPKHFTQILRLHINPATKDLTFASGFAPLEARGARLRVRLPFDLSALRLERSGRKAHAEVSTRHCLSAERSRSTITNAVALKLPG